MTKHGSLTSRCVTVGRIFIVDTMSTVVESEPKEERLVIEHCDTIYEEMWRISINNPMNFQSNSEFDDFTL